MMNYKKASILFCALISCSVFAGLSDNIQKDESKSSLKTAARKKTIFEDMFENPKWVNGVGALLTGMLGFSLGGQAIINWSALNQYRMGLLPQVPRARAVKSLKETTVLTIVSGCFFCASYVLGKRARQSPTPAGESDKNKNLLLA